MNHRSFFAPRVSALMGVGIWLAAFGVARAGEPAASDDTSALLAKIAQYYAQLAEAAKPEEAPVAAVSSVVAPTVRPPVRTVVRQGLQGAALQARGLQPSAGVQGAARGLMPQEDWRLLFPRKVQP